MVTTQMYDFGDVPDAETLTTAGYELVDTNQLVSRAVTAGTGSFRNVGGVQSQELLGLNNADSETFGVSLSITFDLAPVDVETASMKDAEDESMEAETE